MAHKTATDIGREALPTAYIHYPPKKPELARVDFLPIATREERGNGWVTVALVEAQQPAPSTAAAFQQRVQPWLLECFGAEIAADRIERNHRFLEESLELVQALGCTASEAHQLVDYVFGRPVGDPPQEVGGVMVTLAALCLASGLDMHGAGEVELARISAPELVAKIRAKQAAKPKHSPLPETPTAQAAPAATDPAYSEACSLATALFEKHYRQEPDYASGRVVWSLCDTTAGVISQIDNMVSGLARAPAAGYDHGPQSVTVAEAARHVGKWLNERPNRPLDLRDVAMLVAHAQAPAAGAVAGPVVPPEAITASVMRDDGGERPAFCLMAAYRSEKDAMDALATLAAAPTPAAQADSPPSPEVDLIARGMRWEECEALMKEACAQAGVQWDEEKEPQSIAINVMQRLANAAHKVGFTLGKERMAAARKQGAKHD